MYVIAYRKKIDGEWEVWDQSEDLVRATRHVDEFLTEGERFYELVLHNGLLGEKSGIAYVTVSMIIYSWRSGWALLRDFCRCGDCGKLSLLDDVLPLSQVSNLAERFDPGDVVPAGECGCGALTYLVVPRTENE